MKTVILDATSLDSFDRTIEEGADLLRKGELVAFPTETVYGLGADAFNPRAIESVFLAKGRPSDNPLIVHVASRTDLAACAYIDRRAEILAAEFMPGPLTLVLRSRENIPPVTRAGLPTVALRIPGDPVALALIARTGPLVAPSANLSGRPSPTRAEHVYHDLHGRIAAIIDGGPCRLGIESTVVDLSGEDTVMLRPGLITAMEIERILGQRLASIPADGQAPRAPGMKYRHYAPSVPVRLVIAPEPPALSDGLRRLILTTEQHRELFTESDIRLLSEHDLYAAFRDADRLGLDEVLIYATPGELPAGLLDRIQKAGEGNGEGV